MMTLLIKGKQIHTHGHIHSNLLGDKETNVAAVWVAVDTEDTVDLLADPVEVGPGENLGETGIAE